MSKPFQTAKQFDARKFNWDRFPNHIRGYAEASDLGLKAGQAPYSQAYTDACDAGLTLVNPLRGTRMDFLLTSEGEQGWSFRSLEGNLHLTVWND